MEFADGVGQEGEPFENGLQPVGKAGEFSAAGCGPQCFEPGQGQQAGRQGGIFGEIPACAQQLVAAGQDVGGGGELIGLERGGKESLGMFFEVASDDLPVGFQPQVFDAGRGAAEAQGRFQQLQQSVGTEAGNAGFGGGMAVKTGAVQLRTEKYYHSFRRRPSPCGGCGSDFPRGLCNRLLRLHRRSL